MDILFLTEGTTVPASRFRVGQFLPYFEREGINCTVRAAYGDLYNEINQTQIGPLYNLILRLKRAVAGLDASRFDIVFFQRPALPFTALPEQLTTSLNAHTIFDVDDAIYLGPGGRNSLSRQQTFTDEIELARHVICGNDYLAERADAPQKTTVIPTVIDCDKYKPSDSRSDEGPTVIGWMGTSGNFPFMHDIVEPLERVLNARPDTIVRMVSSASYAPLEDHPRVEQIPWSPERELELLRSFDLGLMPLVDNDLTRGKCGFKMIQYMAVGCPVVVSPVGANIDIFEGSNAGYLANGADEWVEAILSLIDDPDRREKGLKGRRHVVEHYSIRSVLDEYLEIFERVSGR